MLADDRIARILQSISGRVPRKGMARGSRGDVDVAAWTHRGLGASMINDIRDAFESVKSDPRIGSHSGNRAEMGVQYGCQTTSIIDRPMAGMTVQLLAGPHTTMVKMRKSHNMRCSGLSG
jgi:hypothetical protein